jgi:hypothetical protein
MRIGIVSAAAAAFVLGALPLSAASVKTDGLRIAQVDVDVVGPRRHDRGVVIEEHKRPSVVIEGTEGRGPHDCVSHSESVTRGNGKTVTQSEQACR